MIKKNILQTIKNKQMDRKDFLKYSGLTLASVVGLKTIISILTQEDTKKVIIEHREATRGFGGGRYGS